MAAAAAAAEETGDGVRTSRRVEEDLFFFKKIPLTHNP